MTIRKDPPASMSPALAWYYAHRDDPGRAQKRVAAAKAYDLAHRNDPVYMEKKRVRFNAAAKRRRAKDPERYRAENRAWKARHPKYSTHLRRRQREEAASRPRPATCELCARPPGKRALDWDHCHASGEFRGWLCSPCNVMLGMARNDPAILRKAIKYLTQTKISAKNW